MATAFKTPNELSPKRAQFIKHFFAVSDDRSKLDEYIACFSEDAVLKFGNAVTQAADIPALRKGMWDKVIKRKHTIFSTYVCDNTRDVMLVGKVDLDFENGESAHNIDFTSRMQFADSEDLKMQHYQVYFDATPAKEAKVKPSQSEYSSKVITLASGKHIHVQQKSPSATSNAAPILFLHGLGSATKYWHGVISSLQAARAREIILVDFDGHGKSSLSGELSITSLANDIGEILDSLQLEKVVLVGHSMSGLVVTAFAASQASRVEKLVCVGGVRKLGEAGVSNMQAREKIALSEGLDSISVQVAEGALSAKTKATNKEAYEAVQALVTATDPTAYAAACKALYTAEDSDYKAIQAPTLLITGDEDKLATPEIVEGLKKEIQNCEVVVLKETGHWQAIESPKEVAENIDRFIGAGPGAKI